MGYMMLMQKVQSLQRKLTGILFNNFENNLHRKADESTQGLPRWCRTLVNKTNEGEA
jgi:hypothetical protein